MKGKWRPLPCPWLFLATHGSRNLASLANYCNILKITVLLICFVVLHFLYRPPVAAVINNCQPLVYTFTLSFIPDWCYVVSPNTYITFPLTQCTIHEYKTGNDVSKFTHSNWITLSYYSSPNTRAWFLNIWYTSLTSVHSNLEHRLAILTESFSPLRSVLHDLSC